MDRALILGGDRDAPAGEFDCSLQVIESGLLQKHGIDKIAIACYPEGHPRIPDDVLDKARADKIAAAAPEVSVSFSSARSVSSPRRSSGF